MAIKDAVGDWIHEEEEVKNLLEVVSIKFI